jgi:RNA polymerase sigma factor (sigma-70 family)
LEEATLGRVYELNPRVREQLATLPRPGGAAFRLPLGIGDTQNPAYLQTEVLVFALRQLRAHDEDRSARQVAGVILERWQGFVWRQARHWCSGNEADQEDFRQEVWCRLWQELPDQREHFWEINFVHALRCLCFDVGQWFARRRPPLVEARPTDTGEDEPLAVADPGPPPWLVVERRDWLRRAMNELDPPTRRVLFLRYLRDWPVAGGDGTTPTICGALGISDRQVRTYLRRGEARLRQWLEKERAGEAD